MNTTVFTRTIASVAMLSAGALVLAGCGAADNAGGAGGDAEGVTTISITTFGTFGYDDLYKEYEAANKDVKIVATNIDTGGNARTDAFTKIAAGSGLSDIVAIEEGWLGSIMEVSDKFADLRDFGIEDRKGDWVDWKYEQGTDASGRVIGYGTDIGPTGVCYNGAAFEAAGLSSDREDVKTLLTGGWDNYFAVGADYVEKTGKAWYDQSAFVWNSMVNQLDEGYYTKDGKLNVEGNAEMEALFTQLGTATEGGQSAAQGAWDWNGGKSFVDGTFATFVCPGWMLGVVKGQVEAGGGDAATGWDFADVFPGGAGNWGGAFLSVTESSKVKEEAAKLADWLTQPEQQIKAFDEAGAFPSTIEAQDKLSADATPNDFFNDAPAGQILSDRAKGVVAQFKGPDDSLIQENIFGSALTLLDKGDLDTKGAWAKAIELLNEQVKK